MQYDRIIYTALFSLTFSLLPAANMAQQPERHEQDRAVEVLSIDSKLIKGKPYVADSTTETVQTLPDGNRIVRHSVSRFYRDSLGRTRREQTFGNIDPANPAPHEVKVFIDDPVSNMAYVLDPGQKEALQLPRSRKFLDEREAESNPPLRKLPPLDEARSITRQDLGSKTIEGIVCNGRQQTITIPAGQLGNERPIAIVTETWVAPGIDTIVQSSTNDPRFGETRYQLHNIQLGEQAISLFQVPSGYRLEQPRQ
ncbi:DUF4412 domain-containing protein [Terriglobus albidus]|uniref:DUF4412 domain-containing protein n=1 Tax=Terriglobus albidus TaxID=1592106 RepID=UPI0021DFD9FF|nr:DUF4412 domain-containing protein [Terriglobus albidus]